MEIGADHAQSMTLSKQAASANRQLGMDDCSAVLNMVEERKEDAQAQKRSQIL